MQSDPHFQDYLQFHEYFHGDNGRGVGASIMVRDKAALQEYAQHHETAAEAILPVCLHLARI
jgi:hypothetical protein